MKNYEAFYLSTKMGPEEDLRFLSQIGYFLFENKQIQLVFGNCTKEEDHAILFATAEDFTRMMKLFEHVPWEYKATCITDKLLSGEFSDERFNQILKRSANKRLLNEFRSANLTKDIVLDIIHKKGMACLTPLELSILKRT